LLYQPLTAPSSSWIANEAAPRVVPIGSTMPARCQSLGFTISNKASLKEKSEPGEKGAFLMTRRGTKESPLNQLANPGKSGSKRGFQQLKCLARLGALCYAVHPLVHEA